MKRIKNYKVLMIILGLSVFVLAACSASSKKEASPTISPTQTTDNPASSQPEPSSPESEKRMFLFLAPLRRKTASSCLL